MIETLKSHIQNRDSDQIIALITEDEQLIDKKDENGVSVLMTLAYHGLSDALAVAINRKKSFTFHEAIVCGQLDRVEDYLDQNDFDGVNRLSDDGFSPVCLAAFFNQTNIAKRLIAEGADPNIPASNPSQVNALHSAVAKQNYELCQFLIQNGSDVNACQMQQVTALHSAVHRGNMKLVQLLVQHGALIAVTMENGDTPISIADREGHMEIAKYLQKMNLRNNSHLDIDLI